MSEHQDENDISMAQMEAQVYKYLKAGVELALGDGVYRYGRLDELEKNILEYISKKLVAYRSSLKFVVVAGFVQKKDKAFAAGSSCFWDSARDGLAKYSHETDTQVIIVTAYWLAVSAT